MTILATMLAEGDAAGTIVLIAAVVISLVSWLIQTAAKKAADERDAETAQKLRERREGAQQQEPRKRQPTRAERRVAREAQTSQIDAALAVASALTEAPAHAEQPEAPEATSRTKRQPKVKLNAKTARQAIILHEILSPPKAMQQETAMWDR